MKQQGATVIGDMDTLPLPKNDSKNIKRHSIHGITEEIDKVKPHQEIGRLTLDEKKYLLAVERGDVALTRLIVAENKPRTKDGSDDEISFDINCIDPLGRSAVMIAIENENIEMLKLLIENEADTKEALLCAISEQFVEAVEILLDHEEKHHKPGTPYSWESVPNSTSMFTPDVTPLILAAHRDNYEIIKILLDKGATVTLPHDIKCGCAECVESQKVDSLQHSCSRINAYRALSSPSFIALSSKDPILTAFELSWELRRLSKLEHEFRSDYHEMRMKCQNFATALLDHVRTSCELEILLNYDKNVSNFQYGQRMRLERLKLAVKLKQKKFVAHPNVQQLLASIWYEGLPGFRRKNIFLQFWKIIWIGILFPVLSSVYIVAPHSSTGLMLRKPFIKFICHSASYFTFLFLLTASSVKRDKTLNVSWIDYVIMLWVFGFAWSEVKQLYSSGLKEYITNLWNILDLITNSLYVVTIGLYIILTFQERTNDPQDEQQGREPALWDDVVGFHQALFSTANILSALRLVHTFSVNPYLGPLQIVLSRMIFDIAKFFLWYVLVLFAFSCGIYQLLGRYAVSDTSDPPSGINKTDVVLSSSNHTDNDNKAASYGNVRSGVKEERQEFSSLFETIQTLFWSAFGVIDLEIFHLDNITPFTKFWGMLTFGTFCVISIVVLLNLLIAMMNHSYQCIFDDADVEWKFARSRLWIMYFSDSGTAPPPFNIIPTPKSVWYMITKIRNCCTTTRKYDQTIMRQLSNNEYRFQAVTRNLVQRYIMAEQKKTGDHAMITMDDINEVKQDISAFRYELLDILKNSGMNIKTVNDSSSCGNKRRRPKNFLHMNPGALANIGNFADTPVDSPMKVVVEATKSQPAKFNFIGFIPSIFQPKPAKTPVSRKAHDEKPYMKRKCESLEKLFERGLLTKYIFRSESEDSPSYGRGENSEVRKPQSPNDKRLVEVEAGLRFIEEAEDRLQNNKQRERRNGIFLVSSPDMGESSRNMNTDFSSHLSLIEQANLTKCYFNFKDTASYSSMEEHQDTSSSVKPSTEHKQEKKKACYSKENLRVNFRDV